MISKQDQYNSLMEESIYLCELRGELDDEANATIEQRLTEIGDELTCLRWEMDQDAIETSCEFL